MTVAPDERIVIAASERRPAVLEIIDAARDRLVLSLFRCSDAAVLDALARARARGTRVEALVTRRAKKSVGKLKKLRRFLQKIGAEVHEYADPVVKYHAKYMVADGAVAAVASFNFTRKCFTRTCDFLVVSRDPDLVSGLERLFDTDRQAAGAALPDEMTDRLIVAPGRARLQLSRVLGGARRSIRIVDRKLSDAKMLALLSEREAAGVAVHVLRERTLDGLDAHGKLLLVDDEIAVVGSLPLSAIGLDFRREVAVQVRDPHAVQALGRLFDVWPARAGKAEPASELR